MCMCVSLSSVWESVCTTNYQQVFFLPFFVKLKCFLVVCPKKENVNGDADDSFIPLRFNGMGYGYGWKSHLFFSSSHLARRAIPSVSRSCGLLFFVLDTTIIGVGVQKKGRSNQYIYSEYMSMSTYILHTNTQKYKQQARYSRDTPIFQQKCTWALIVTDSPLLAHRHVGDSNFFVRIIRILMDDNRTDTTTWEKSGARGGNGNRFCCGNHNKNNKNNKKNDLNALPPCHDQLHCSRQQRQQVGRIMTSSTRTNHHHLLFWMITLLLYYYYHHHRYHPGFHSWSPVGLKQQQQDIRTTSRRITSQSGFLVVLVVHAWSPSLLTTKRQQRRVLPIGHWSSLLFSPKSQQEGRDDNMSLMTSSSSCCHFVPGALLLGGTHSSFGFRRPKKPCFQRSSTLALYRDGDGGSGNNEEHFHNDDDDEEDDEDDDEPPEVDISQFSYANSNLDSSSSSISSFGYNKGRSSPSQRKAMGRSSSSVTHIHICSNCGSEFVKWMGRCPTCKQWNTLQEHAVLRDTTTTTDPFGNTVSGGGGVVGGPGRPVFGGRGIPSRPQSWLDGILSTTTTTTGASMLGQGKPVRITDLYPPTDDDNKNNPQKTSPTSSRQRFQQQRIRVPHDDEFNTVLGGGILPGSLILVGGDPGVGKSTLLLQTAGDIATHISTPMPQIGMGLPQPKITSKNSKNNNKGSSSSNDGNNMNLSTPSSPQPLGPVWYCSGEESPDQIASRAQRLGIDSPELWLLAETHVDSLCAQVVQHMQPISLQPNQQSGAVSSTRLNGNDNKDDDDHHDQPPSLSSSTNHVLQPLPPSLLIVDSIQTLVCTSGGHSAAGGVTQVRECVALLLRLAKLTGIPIVLVGHVTKTGDVAGPRTVEHMVDCVLYLEGGSSGSSGAGGGGGGDSYNPGIRVLRASKNRFGSSEEVGVYEMTAGRLMPVSDPSSLFLSHRAFLGQEDAEGCAIAIVLEGMRAIAVEVQALVASAGGSGGRGGGFGRRTVDGLGHARLLLLMGVLQKRCGFGNLARHYDVYVNVAGRMRLNSGGTEHGNAADLATAIALVSSYVQIGVRADTAFVGEVGLLGELRPVASMEKRIQEARRMGFSRVISSPTSSLSSSSSRSSSLSSSSSSFSTNQNTSSQTMTSRHTFGVEWIQCRRLYDALQAGLVQPIPPTSTTQKSRRRGKQNNSNNKNNSPRQSSSSSSSLSEDLDDFEILFDDDDDDDEDYGSNAFL